MTVQINLDPVTVVPVQNHLDVMPKAIIQEVMHVDARRANNAVLVAEGAHQVVVVIDTDVGLPAIPPAAGDNVGVDAIQLHGIRFDPGFHGEAVGAGL